MSKGVGFPFNVQQVGDSAEFRVMSDKAIQIVFIRVLVLNVFKANHL